MWKFFLWALLYTYSQNRDLKKKQNLMNRIRCCFLRPKNHPSRPKSQCWGRCLGKMCTPTHTTLAIPSPQLSAHCIWRAVPCLSMHQTHLEGWLLSCTPQSFVFSRPGLRHENSFVFFFLRFIFIYFFIFGCAGSSLLYRVSLVVENRGYSWWQCGLLITVASLAVGHGLQALGLQ